MFELTQVLFNFKTILTVGGLVAQRWGIIVTVGVVAFLTYWFSSRYVRASRLKMGLNGQLMMQVMQVQDFEVILGTDSKANLEMAKLKERLEVLIQSESSTEVDIDDLHTVPIQELHKVLSEVVMLLDEPDSFEFPETEEFMQDLAERFALASQLLTALSTRYQEVYSKGLLEELEFHANKIEGFRKRCFIRTQVYAGEKGQLSVDGMIEHFNLLADYVEEHLETHTDEVLHLAQMAYEMSESGQAKGEVPIERWLSMSTWEKNILLNHLYIAHGVKYTFESYSNLRQAIARFIAIGLKTIREIKLELKFRELAERWKRETGHMSIMSDIVSHPTYQQIIALGTQAIPLILRELEREPDHWFWALQQLTGANPIKPEDRGRLQKMTQAWLDWGERNGFE